MLKALDNIYFQQMINSETTEINLMFKGTPTSIPLHKKITQHFVLNNIATLGPILNFIQEEYLASLSLQDSA